MVNLRDHSSRYPFPMSSTVRWDRPLLQTLVATHMRLLPCISWKTPKRNLCHLDWTFNIRTLNWTFTYGIGLEEENKFKFQFWTCHVRTIKPTLWVYSNGLWSYRKLSVLKKNIPSIPNIFSPPPPSFPPAKKRHVSPNSALVSNPDSEPCNPVELWNLRVPCLQQDLSDQTCQAFGLSDPKFFGGQRVLKRRKWVVSNENQGNLPSFETGRLLLWKSSFLSTSESDEGYKLLYNKTSTVFGFCHSGCI